MPISSKKLSGELHLPPMRSLILNFFKRRPTQMKRTRKICRAMVPRYSEMLECGLAGSIGCLPKTRAVRKELVSRMIISAAVCQAGASSGALVCCDGFKASGCEGTSGSEGESVCMERLLGAHSRPLPSYNEKFGIGRRRCYG